MLLSLVSAPNAPQMSSPERTVHAGPRTNTQQTDLMATGRLAAQQMKGYFSAYARSKLVWPLLLLLAYVLVGRVVLILMSTKAELDQQLLVAAAYSAAATHALGGGAPTALELTTLHAGRRLDSQQGSSGGMHSSDRLGSRRGLRPPRSSLSDSAPAAPSRTLQFKVCNGFTNQRLALVYGILLAVKTRRVPVIPCMLSDGEQLTTATISAGLGDEGCEPFSNFYDEQFFVQRMLEGGVQVLTQAVNKPATELSADVLRANGGDTLKSLNSTASNMAHVSMDCALWGLQATQLEPGDEQLMWHTLSALQPAAHLQVRMCKEIASKMLS